MSLVLPTQKIYSMKEEIQLPEDLIDITNSNIETDYKMPTDYTGDFLPSNFFDIYTQDELNRWYSNTREYELVKEVHLYKDLFNVHK